MVFAFRFALVVAQVAVDPQDGGVPVFGTLQRLINAAALFALCSCALAILIGVIATNMSTRTGHEGGATMGRTLVSKGALGAVIVGCSAAFVNFMFGLGQGIK